MSHLYKTPFLLKLLYPSMTWKVKSKDKKIYLTFDDGPIPGITDFVLEQLRLYNAKGTFFCVGENIGKNPEVYKRILDEGHAVGNHTYNHLNGWNNETQHYLENVSKCDEVMNQFKAKDMVSKLFRPPYGRMTRAQLKVVKHTHQIIMWDVLTADFDKNLKPEICLQKAIKNTEPGSIVIFHDSVKAEVNLKFTLPRYLAHFSGLGYSFESL